MPIEMHIFSSERFINYFIIYIYLTSVVVDGCFVGIEIYCYTSNLLQQWKYEMLPTQILNTQMYCTIFILKFQITVLFTNISFHKCDEIFLKLKRNRVPVRARTLYDASDWLRYDP